MQVRCRHPHRWNGRRPFRESRFARRRVITQQSQSKSDSRHRDQAQRLRTLLVHSLQYLGQSFQGMVSQEHQNLDELPRSGVLTQSLLQRGTQCGKYRGQLPVPIHRRVIQARRLAGQSHQIMQWIQLGLPRIVTPRMRGHTHPSAHDLHAIDIGLQRQCLKRSLMRYAVRDFVKPHCLQLVRLRLAHETGLEPSLGQRGRDALILLKLSGNRHTSSRHHPLPVLTAPLLQVRIQRVHVGHTRYGSRPLPLQPFHAILDVWFLVPPRRHTEQGGEVVVARQCHVQLVQPPVPTTQDLHGHCLRVVPPDLFGNTSEVLKRCDHAVQNCLGALRRQGDRKHGIGVGPGSNQNRHLATSPGKVDLDLPEVELHPASRSMVQRNECLPLVRTVGGDIPLHLGIAALVPLLSLQPPVDPRCRMPLLGRLLFIRLQDLIDPGLKWAQLGSRIRLAPAIRPRLRALQNLPNLLPRMMVHLGQTPDAHPFPVGLSNPRVIVQLQHPLTSTHHRRN